MARRRTARRKGPYRHLASHLIDPLEQRQLLSVQALANFSTVLATPSNPSANAITLSDYLNDPQTAQIVTDLGEIDVSLTPTYTPQTVTNFAQYAATGEYNETFFHRTAVLSTGNGGSPTTPADIVQGGGYTLQQQSDGSEAAEAIATNAPIPDEAATEEEGNVAGTIAMARTSDPNSATSQFYFNVNDNSSALDYDPATGNPGYCVFGTVTSGMNVVNEIAALPTETLDASQGLTTVPYDTGLSTADNLVNIESVTIPSTCTFTATSSNPGLVRPDVNGNELSFEYGTTAGVATITVTATSTIDGSSQTETFPVVLPLPTATGSTATGPIAPNQSFTMVNTGATAPTDDLNILGACTDTTAGLYPNQVSVVANPTNGTAVVDPSDGDIDYTPNAGFVGTDTFTYTVADYDSSSGASTTSAAGTVTVTVNGQNSVTIGRGGAPSFRFTQADGTAGDIHVATGTAVITFDGQNVAFTRRADGDIASATVSIDTITITDAPGHLGSLEIAGSGGKNHGQVVVNSIQSIDPLYAILAPTTELTGESNFHNITVADVGSLNHASIDMGYTPTLVFGSAVDSSLTGNAQIRMLKVGSWTADDANTYTVIATSIQEVACTGAFDASLQLIGTGYDLRSAVVNGTLGSSWSVPWVIDGEAGAIRLGAVSPDMLDLEVGGSLTSLAVRGSLSGAYVQAAVLDDLTVSGDLANSTIVGDANDRANARDVAVVSVSGAISGSEIASVGNIGVIAAGSLTASAIGAGITSDDLTLAGSLPTAASDFTADATIAAVTLRTAFSNSRIEAEHLGVMSLGSISTDNQATPEGLVGETVSAVRGQLSTDGKNTGRVILGRPQLLSSAALSGYISKEGLALGDFQIDLIAG